MWLWNFQILSSVNKSMLTVKWWLNTLRIPRQPRWNELFAVGLYEISRIFLCGNFMSSMGLTAWSKTDEWMNNIEDKLEALVCTYQRWISYLLKITCYSYKLLFVTCYSYLLHFSKVTCYSYCYIFKVTSYFTSYLTDTSLHHLYCRVFKLYFNYKYPVLVLRKHVKYNVQHQNCIKHLIWKSSVTTRTSYKNWSAPN